jgi:hypothetical protein
MPFSQDDLDRQFCGDVARELFEHHLYTPAETFQVMDVRRAFILTQRAANQSAAQIASAIAAGRV